MKLVVVPLGHEMERFGKTYLLAPDTQIGAPTSGRRDRWSRS